MHVWLASIHIPIRYMNNRATILGLIKPKHSTTGTARSSSICSIATLNTYRFASSMANNASLKRAQDFVNFLNASPTRRLTPLINDDSNLI